MLQVLCFAVLFGVSLALVGDVAAPVTVMIERISIVLFKMMSLILRLATLGVLGAVGYTVGRYGDGSLKQLISLVVLYLRHRERQSARLGLARGGRTCSPSAPRASASDATAPISANAPATTKAALKLPVAATT